MAKWNIPDVDKLRQLNARVRQNIQHIATNTHEAFWQPELERQDWHEYISLTPEDHAAIIEQMGYNEYISYVQAMENLRRRHAKQLR